MAESKKQLNIAMVGSGFIARAHSNTFHQVGRFFDSPFELNTKVVCARDANRLDRFAQQWGWKEACTDWQADVSRFGIEVVDIAVMNVLMADMALLVMYAGRMF